MKIFAIIGSPRKGNTFCVVRKVEEAIHTLDHDAQFDYLFLKDAGLELCRGCFICIAKGEHMCPLKDARASVVERMLAADAIVFAAPSYAQNVPAIMKNLIDRLSYLCHRPVFFEKQALIITTSCGGGINETLGYLEKIARSWGFTSVRRLGLMFHPAMGLSPKSEAKILRIANEFYTAVKQREQNPPTLIDLLQFRFMKHNAAFAPDHFPADRDFFAGKEDYFVEGRATVVKKTVAKLLQKVILKIMDATM